MVLSVLAYFTDGDFGHQSQNYYEVALVGSVAQLKLVLL
jgi:hypothetical protein